MTEKMIENRVRKLLELEAQQKELATQADAIRAQLKADLEEKGLEELHTKNFVVRWRQIISRRLDCTALKAALPDVYAQYSRESSTKRLTVA